MRVFWETGGLLRALAELRAEERLPCRVVLVPRERVAHALRRELLRIGRADLLAGTRFVGPANAALEVLRGAGFDRVLGEEALRPLRLRALFAQDLELEGFDLELLRTARGWDRAIGLTIGGIEAADLSPHSLSAEGIEGDLARLWSALDAEARESVTLGRLYGEAADCLELGARWPFEGPVLAPVTGFESATLARFVGAIPLCTIAIAGARPRRESHLARLDALFGNEARRALEESTPAARIATERDRLAAHLFEDPSRLAGAGRSVSSGRDGTVELESTSGVDAEIDAAVDWVAREVLEHATPLEDIAVLAPRLDPWAELLTSRLSGLDWAGRTPSIFVAGGLPATSLAGGARVETVLGALRGYLDPEGLADVLPLLRPSVDGARRLSRGAAIDLVAHLGSLGGSGANPEGALRWRERIYDRSRAWAERAAGAVDLDGEEPRPARSAGDATRRLERLERVGPALGALLGVARHVVERAPLDVLWPALRRLLDDWLLLPGEGASIPSRLDSMMAPLCQSVAGRGLRGDEGLRAVDAALGAIRLALGRFGEPAVYVGTVEGAVGIPFRAVRILGLAEGSLPTSAREDPVLGDADRRRLGPQLPTTGLRIVCQLQALDHVVRSTRRRIALSSPRLGVERSQREPSGVFIEVGAALRRSGQHSGGAALGAPVPNAAILSRSFFEPARRERRTYCRRTPLIERHWQDRVASHQGRAPSHWADRPEHDLDRLRDLRQSIGGPSDGILGPAPPGARVPGLSADRAVSASGLRDLLECPYRFLLARLLGFREPVEVPSRGEIEGLDYGGLFHKVAEQFARAHGQAFGHREGTLDEWLPVARELADGELATFLEEYPLEPGMAREQQRRRLQRDFEALVRYEWGDGHPRRFVATERRFGFETPVAIATVHGPLYLHGYIDRLDVEGGRTLVRDLKTGWSKPREGKLGPPRTKLDLQLGVYGLVTRQRAGQWGVPTEVAAAYVYPLTPATPERAFDDDFDDLASSTLSWLAIARGLLAEGQFGHTPDPDDCKYCAFVGVCEPDVHRRAEQMVESVGGPLADLAALKQAQG